VSESDREKADDSKGPDSGVSDPGYINFNRAGSKLRTSPELRDDACFIGFRR